MNVAKYGLNDAEWTAARQEVARMPDGSLRPLMYLPGRNPHEEGWWLDLRTFKTGRIQAWLDAGAALYELQNESGKRTAGCPEKGCG